jgi:monoamine oxidase
VRQHAAIPAGTGPYLDRRHFLATLLAGAALPGWARAQTTSPDVVIVGAGSAGLAAAHFLAAKGLSFVIVEAKDRIGGRAFTDTETFGLPFDHGCSWLHQSDRNPYTPIAKQGSFTLIPHDDAGESVFVGNRPANEAELDDYDRTWKSTKRVMRELGEQDMDVAPASFLPVAPPWTQVCNGWLGPLSMGTDVEDMSAVDWWKLDYTEPNLMIREGFGTLVARYGQDVPVSLATPATRIRWDGKGVRVETPSGTIAAKACIVTVSTGVLASGAIRFDPALPTKTESAIDGLPMGLLAKIPLQFEGTRLGLAPNEWMSYAVSDERLCFFLSWPFDMDLMIGWIGGRFGWELSQAGPDTAVDFALGELRKIFGSEVDQRFVRGTLTQWANDPAILGGYAYQRPGARGARRRLSAPVGDRLYFAGEATAGSMAMTCGGAFLSGERAAREVVRDHG